jgi:IS605 OrfB family transposase
MMRAMSEMNRERLPSPEWLAAHRQDVEDVFVAILNEVVAPATEARNHIVTSVDVDGGQLSTAIDTGTGPDAPDQAEHPQALGLLGAYMAAGIALPVALRTFHAGQVSQRSPGGVGIAVNTVRGWFFDGTSWQPLGESEICAAQCTGHRTAELSPPEAGVRYVPVNTDDCADMSASLRQIAAPYVADPAAGVNVRTRLKNLTAADQRVLLEVGAHLGRLASADLARRVRDGLDHDKDSWAARKRDITTASTARWAGAITKVTHDQWGLARRAQAAHIQSLMDAITTICHRLSLPLGQRGVGGKPGSYRSRAEWFHKTRRLAALQARLATVEAHRVAGRVHVVRGGKRLLHKRHHLSEAGLTEAQWRAQWEAARWFIEADGESGKRWGNETIRVAGDGELSLRLPALLGHLANAPHGRYVLSGKITFGHRGQEWADRVEANRAVAYRIHFSPNKQRWYLDAAWQRPPVPAVPLKALRAGELVGVDMNADHLTAWRLDPHGNPIGAPRTFEYDLSGGAARRDAQVRHALTRLLHWATNTGSKAISVEDLDFTDATTREKHGRRRRFRQVISGMPTAKLRARLISMATEHGIGVIAVDPAYTSKWSAQHWHKPLAAHHPQTTRHHAASVAIGRRALGHRIRRRVAPPPPHQSDVAEHRTTQAESDIRERETTRHPRPGPPTRSACPPGAKNAGSQAPHHRSGPPTEQNSVSLSV